MADYRWNDLDTARGYDAAAEVVHPYYHEIQDVIIEHLPQTLDAQGCVIDLGGGSGRLAQRILERFTHLTVWVIDQSPSCLTLARDRLQPYGGRARCVQASLQSDWSQQFDASPIAIISMSAIHHLDPGEKQRLYQQCADCLAPGGVLMNGDEVRPPDDAEYLAVCRRWAEHMHRGMDSGRIPRQFHSALLAWEARNVAGFGESRVSGDDCHETADVQLKYYLRSGLVNTSALWQRELWAVLYGQKPA